MTDQHRLIHQNEQVDNVALATLAARTALQLSAAFTTLTTSFLIKRVRYFLKLHSVAVDEGPFLVGLARGNAIISEITAALTANNAIGKADITEVLTEDQPWVIYQETVRMLTPSDSGGEYLSDGRWNNMPGRGLPAVEGSGWQVFIANLDGTALTTGAEIQGMVQTQGVWLND